MIRPLLPSFFFSFFIPCTAFCVTCNLTSCRLISSAQIWQKLMPVSISVYPYLVSATANQAPGDTQMDGCRSVWVRCKVLIVWRKQKANTHTQRDLFFPVFLAFPESFMAALLVVCWLVCSLMLIFWVNDMVPTYNLNSMIFSCFGNYFWKFYNNFKANFKIK